MCELRDDAASLPLVETLLAHGADLHAANERGRTPVHMAVFREGIAGASLVRDGIGPDFAMDSFDGPLAAEEIWNVVNYVKSLSEP